MSKSNLWNIILVLMLAVVIYMLFLQRCSPSEFATVKTIKEQTEIVKHDSIISQHYKDSVQGVINNLEYNANRYYNNWKVAANEYSLLEQSIGNGIAQTLPDTCKKYQDWIISEYNKLIVASRKKDTATLKTIYAKDNIISQKNKLLANSKEDYKKLRNNLDTCFKQQKTLQDKVKELSPRREIYAGITSNVYPSFGIGIALGLRNKKGTQFEASVIQFHGKANYSVSIKKTLFKF
jgi:uncharacterized protein HemX